VLIVALPFCPDEARETTQIIKDLKTKFKNFLGQQKNPRLFQDVATL